MPFFPHVSARGTERKRTENSEQQILEEYGRREQIEDKGESKAKVGMRAREKTGPQGHFKFI